MAEKYYRRNHDNEYRLKLNQKDRETRKKLRMDIINHYGNKCVCCGESHEEFLTMDHVNNNGAEHRREIGRTSSCTYRWIKKNNYPNSFQILCWNCNESKHHRGYCPHNGHI